MFQLMAKEKGIELYLEVKSKLPSFFYTDQRRLKQVLLNLVGNAVKFTKKGSIKLILENSSSDNQDLVRFSVKDTGIGIRQEKIGRLFRIFGQVNQEVQEEAAGTGLGLHISKQIALQLGPELS